MKGIKRFIAYLIKTRKRYDPFIKKINDDNIFAIAGQSAFFLILSAVPLAMFVVSLLQNMHISVEFIEKGLSGLFSKEVVNQVSTLLSSAYENTIGISLITLIITLWSAAKGIHAITNGLNRIYNAYENRNWLFRRVRAMIYTIAFFVIIVGLLVVIVLGKTINDWLSPYISLLPDFIAIIYYFRYIIVFLLLVVLFAAVYRNFPNISRDMHREYGLKYQLPGAFLCTISWYVLSLGISIYVSDFNGFSIYGGLTRLAIIMVWVYFCMVCLMLCAEINFFFHEQIKSFSIKRFLKARKNKRKTRLKK